MVFCSSEGQQVNPNLRIVCWLIYYISKNSLNKCSGRTNGVLWPNWRELISHPLEKNPNCLELVPLSYLLCNSNAASSSTAADKLERFLFLLAVQQTQKRKETTSANQVPQIEWDIHQRGAVLEWGLRTYMTANGMFAEHTLLRAFAWTQHMSRCVQDLWRLWGCICSPESTPWDYNIWVPPPKYVTATVCTVWDVFCTAWRTSLVCKYLQRSHMGCN